MTWEYSNAWDAEYARQLAAGLDIDTAAYDAAGRAAEQAQRDCNGIEPLEMDTRQKRQYMSIRPNTYGESVWLAR